MKPRKPDPYTLPPGFDIRRPSNGKTTFVGMLRFSDLPGKFKDRAIPIELRIDEKDFHRLAAYLSRSPEAAKEFMIPTESRRRSGGNVFYKYSMSIPDGVVIQTRYGLDKDWHPPLNFTLRVPTKQREFIFKVIERHPERFARSFQAYMHILAVKLGQIGDDPLFWRRHEAAFLYQFFSYWMHRDQSEWPPYLSRILDIAEQEACIQRKPNGNLKVEEITEFAFAKINAPLLRDSGEASDVEFTEGFRRRYVYGSAKDIVSNQYFDNKSPKEVAALAHEYLMPINDLCHALNIA
jgi:hypothetical protein